MNVDQEKPAAQVALDELAAVAQTPEDHAELAKWQAEYEQERTSAIKGIGTEVTKLAVMPDGSVTTVEQAIDLRDSEEKNHPYGNAGRR